MIVLTIILLIFLSAFFSGSETAFISLDKITLKQIETSTRKRYKNITRLLSDPHKLIISILIGNTIVNIAASSLVTGLFYGLFGEKGVAFSIIGMMAILLVFGEVTPKMFAFSYPLKYSSYASTPLLLFEKIFSPMRSPATCSILDKLLAH